MYVYLFVCMDKYMYVCMYTCKYVCICVYVAIIANSQANSYVYVWRFKLNKLYKLIAPAAVQTFCQILNLQSSTLPPKP